MNYKHRFLGIMLLPLTFGPAYALDPDPGLKAPPDNSARQIALLGNPADLSHKVAPSKKVAANSTLQGAGKLHRSEVKHWSDIHLRLPDDVEDAVDACCVAGRKVEIVCLRRMNYLMHWLGEVYRQLNSAPAITPVGSPYTSSSLVSQRNPQVYWSRDGRIKTVADR